LRRRHCVAPFEKNILKPTGLVNPDRATLDVPANARPLATFHARCWLPSQSGPSEDVVAEKCDADPGHPFGLSVARVI
jgi:hypothetical protein